MSKVCPKDRLDVLYVSYDGLLEPLGRSQVVRYLEGLASTFGLRIAVLSFEKPRDYHDPERRGSLERELESLGITWRALPYHRRLRVLATAWDIVRGCIAGVRLARRHRPALVQARSYVAGLIGLATKTLSGASFVFDMRGFWPEERVELGLFRSQGLLYRASKVAEKSLLSSADHVVVLTESAKAILKHGEAKTRLESRVVRDVPVTVIPCCVDLERYRPLPPDKDLVARHHLDSTVLVGNIGAFNRRYLTHEMFRFTFHLKSHRPNLRFVYLTNHEPRAVQRVAREAGLREADLLVLAAAPEDVPRWLSLFRLGVFFLRPSYAAKASSFTKLGEFLAAGVPVVTNRGVGDVDRILGSDRCGLLLPGLTDRELSNFAKLALPLLEGESGSEQMRRSCRATAMEFFDLAEGVRRYRAVYDSLTVEPRETKDATLPVEAH